MSSSPTSSSSAEGPKAARLEPGPSPAARPGFAVLRHVECRVTALVGTGHLSVRECLALRPQSVLRLDQAAGGDLAVSVNGVSVARGEVTIVEDSTSIRLTEILEPRDDEVDP